MITGTQTPANVYYTAGLPDASAAAKRANAKLQRLENERARREGREPRDLRADRIAAARAIRAARA